MRSIRRRLAVLALGVGLLAAVFGAAPAVADTPDYPWFACAVGSGHLSSAAPVQTVRQGDTAVFTIDIERVGCDDQLLFSLDPSYLPPGGTVTWGENPTTANAITLTFKTSKTWPAVTPVGSYGALIYVDAHSGLSTNFFGVELDVVAATAPIARTPASTLRTGTTIGSSSVRVRTSWTATDPDGIKRYQVQRQKNGGAWTSVALPSATSTHVTQPLAYGATYRYRVRATDTLGHLGPYAYGRPFVPRLVQQTSGAISSDWHWTTVRTGSASGGSLKYQPYSGSEFFYKFRAASVAFVPVKGPTRSNITDIFSDDVMVKSALSLWAHSTTYRRIAFAMNYGSNGNHVLDIRNMGWVGRSRIDIDAFVLLVNR